MAYFVELLPSIASMHLRVPNTSQSSSFEFKSEDGTFYFRAKRPDLAFEVANEGIKLVPGLTKIEQTSGVTFFNFKLDPKFLSNHQPKALTYPEFKQETRVTGLSCAVCETEFFSGQLTLKAAPSELFSEVQTLWQCHNESFASVVDPVTKLPVFEPSETLRSPQTLCLHASLSLKNIDHESMQCGKCSLVVGFSGAAKMLFLSAIRGMACEQNWVHKCLKALYGKQVLFEEAGSEWFVSVKTLGKDLVVATEARVFRDVLRLEARKQRFVSQGLKAVLKEMHVVKMCSKMDFEVGLLLLTLCRYSTFVTSFSMKTHFQLTWRDLTATWRLPFDLPDLKIISNADPKQS